MNRLCLPLLAGLLVATAPAAAGERPGYDTKIDTHGFDTQMDLGGIDRGLDATGLSQGNDFSDLDRQVDWSDMNAGQDTNDLDVPPAPEIPKQPAFLGESMADPLPNGVWPKPELAPAPTPDSN